MMREPIESSPFFNQALSMVCFTEISGTCLGNTFDGVHGHGIGKKLGKQILHTLKSILDNESKLSPYVFEILDIFQEGVGCDLISDLLIYVLQDTIYEYNSSLIETLGLSEKPMVSVKSKIIYGKTYKLLKNQVDKTKRGSPIVLLPEDILAELPVFGDFADISFIGEHNEEVRKELTKWIDILPDHRPLRDDICKAVYTASANNVNFPSQLVQVYLSIDPKKYDFLVDPQGLYITKSEFAKFLPGGCGFNIGVGVLNKSSSSYDVALKSCEYIKDCIENKGGWSYLNSKEEKAFQTVFMMIGGYIACENGFDFSPESNSGNGPVDFKISKGLDKVLVEVKLLTNGRLLNAISESGQINQYLLNHGCSKSICLVFGEKKSEKYKKLIDLNNSLSPEQKNKIHLFFISTDIQQSASKM
jgi:hypothetical protein